MNMHRISVAAILLAAVALAVGSGCQPARPPAQFSVSPLSFKPAQATVGQSVTVSADISNVGGSQGVYEAALSLDGTNIQTKDIDLQPGDTQTVNFIFSRDKPGTYQVAIGKASAAYSVGPKLVRQDMELKNDNSVVADYLSVVKPYTGYLETFTPPAATFLIDSVRINGLIYGGHGFMIRDIELKILDKDNNVLFTQAYSGNKFPVITFLNSNLGAQGAWVDLDVPGVEVNGNFFVHIYTGNTEQQGFRMGTSDSLGNTHSDLTIRDTRGVDNPSSNWPYGIANWFGNKSRVNWLVHVVGTGMVPGG